MNPHSLPHRRVASPPLSPAVNAQTRSDERAAEQHGPQRGNGSEARSAQTNRWANICERLTAALRGWPTSEIEREVRLSEPQRVAFYELVTTSLKAAEALARACPADTALIVHIDVLRPVGVVSVLVPTRASKLWKAVEISQKRRIPLRARYRVKKN